MLRPIEFISWLAGGIAGNVSNSAGHAHARPWADKLEEFVLRLRRAGLLFFGAIAALLVLSLIAHPTGLLLLWFLAFPLAGFGSVLSMFWPTRRFAKSRFQGQAGTAVGHSTLVWLNQRRGEIPLASRAAFDLVIERVKRSQTLVGSGDDLLAKELRRLVNQHLPRLVQSFLDLPPGEQNMARNSEFTEGLSEIAEELHALNERLLASRTDRFEIERRFIANRYPRRNGLAAP